MDTLDNEEKAQAWSSSVTLLEMDLCVKTESTAADGRMKKAEEIPGTGQLPCDMLKGEQGLVCDPQGEVQQIFSPKMNICCYVAKKTPNFLAEKLNRLSLRLLNEIYIVLILCLLFFCRTFWRMKALTWTGCFATR